MRALIVPPEFGDRHDQRRNALIASTSPRATERFEVEFQRRDGSRFPGEATVSKVDIQGEVFVSGFITDVTERLRRQAEREALLREQAARAEAERVAELVGGMQALVDAALAHRTLDGILRELVTQVRGVLDADAATIYLADESERLTVGASAPGDISGGDEFANRVGEAREAMLAQNDASANAGALVGVPLLAEGEVTGVLVACATPPREFGGEDLTLLRLAAERVGLAIAHARVYEREHRIAETLQRSLLPDRLPSLPGLDVAARYLPAASEAEVGGDWYDVIPIAGGAVGLVMGDVAGKGLAGASMVGRLRSALRAYALEGHDGARVVEQLNRLLWTEAEESQMATMLYVIVDPAASAVRWVNAGHPAPLMVVDGEPRFLEGAGSVPLGVLPFPTYEEVSDRMDPGSTLLLYTDGLVERPGENIDDGMAELAARVRGGARGSGRALRPPAGDARSRGRGHGRRGAADPAQPPRPGSLQRRVPRRAGVARADAEHAAPLAQPRRGGRARDRRDRHGVRRGGHERDRARGHERRNPLRGLGRPQRPRGRDRRARPGLVARGAPRRPRPRPRPDEDADGYGCGGSHSGGDDR